MGFNFGCRWMSFVVVLEWDLVDFVLGVDWDGWILDKLVKLFYGVKN